MSEPAVRFRALILAAAFSVLGSCSATEPDGLGSVILPAPDDPLVHFRVLVKVGSANDPSGKDGLCLLTWNLVATGATRSSGADEIAARIERLGAKFSVTVDKEASVFSADVGRENLNAFYATFKELLLSPGLGADDLELVKADRILRFEVPAGEEDLGSFSRDALDRLIYEGHPYGRPPSEAVASIGGITSVDARVFYGQHFVRGNVIIGLAGGFPRDFPDRVVADFERVPAGFTPSLKLPAPRRPPGPEVLIVEMPVPHPAVAMGSTIDPGLTAAESAALEIAAASLGVDAGTRLVRDRFRRQRLFPVPLIAGGEDDPVGAIPASLQAYREMIDGGIPEDRFEPVRKSVFDEAQASAGRSGDRLLAGVAALSLSGGADEVAGNLVALVDLKRRTAEAVLRKRLDPARIRIAIVTADAESARRLLAGALPAADIRVSPAAEVFKPPAAKKKP